MLLKSRGTLLVILDTLFDVELLLDDEEVVFCIEPPFDDVPEDKPDHDVNSS